MGARRKEISVVEVEDNQICGWRNNHIPKDGKRLSGGMEIYENNRESRNMYRIITEQGDKELSSDFWIRYEYGEIRID